MNKEHCTLTAYFLHVQFHCVCQCFHYVNPISCLFFLVQNFSMFASSNKLLMQNWNYFSGISSFSNHTCRTTAAPIYTENGIEYAFCNSLNGNSVDIIQSKCLRATWRHANKWKYCCLLFPLSINSIFVFACIRHISSVVHLIITREWVCERRKKNRPIRAECLQTFVWYHDNDTKWCHFFGFVSQAFGQWKHAFWKLLFSAIATHLKSSKNSMHFCFERNFNCIQLMKCENIAREWKPIERKRVIIKIRTQLISAIRNYSLGVVDELIACKCYTAISNIWSQ